MPIIVITNADDVGPWVPIEEVEPIPGAPFRRVYLSELVSATDA